MGNQEAPTKSAGRVNEVGWKWRLLHSSHVNAPEERVFNVVDMVPNARYAGHPSPQAQRLALALSPDAICLPSK
jgi:hypothetical protein